MPGNSSVVHALVYRNVRRYFVAGILIQGAFIIAITSLPKTSCKRTALFLVISAYKGLGNAGDFYFDQTVNLFIKYMLHLTEELIAGTALW